VDLKRRAILLDALPGTRIWATAIRLKNDFMVIRISAVQQQAGADRPVVRLISRSVLPAARAPSPGTGTPTSAHGEPHYFNGAECQFGSSMPASACAAEPRQIGGDALADRVLVDHAP